MENNECNHENSQLIWLALTCDIEDSEHSFAVGVDASLCLDCGDISLDEEQERDLARAMADKMDELGIDWELE